MGAARARLVCLIRARLAALGGQALPQGGGARLRGEGGPCRRLLGIAASRIADSSAFGRTGGIGLAGPRRGQRRARRHRHRGHVEILDDSFDGRRARSSRVRSSRVTGRLSRPATANAAPAVAAA